MDCWLNLGITGGCCWPTEDKKILFGGHEFLLKPATRETEQSIHINISKEKMSRIDAMTLVNRFLSIISWCDGGNGGMDIIYDIGVSNVAPIAIPMRRRMLGSSIDFPFYRDIEKNHKASLALALYREGLVTDSVPLSFLSFFKIINIFYNDKTTRVNKQKPQNELIASLGSLLQHIKCDLATKRIDELKKSVNDIPKYLYERRCAIAHAFVDPTIDPDNVAESRDLSQDTWIIRAIADYLIEKKLNVSKSILG
ncbi:MAG: hypothetical protein PHC54_02520 [Candidatus Omnitrophica bacterium]|nr:hypothetical protein [Candidatus Omnitrophota bacterium]MDD5592252.1 hypothetical protein [Candidatus Omnitrophota bacterium]